MVIRVELKPTEWIKVHYLDACAVVRIFIEEEGSKELKKYFEMESNFWMTSICFIEALGVLKKKCFYEKLIMKKEYLDACDELMVTIEEKIIRIDEFSITNSETFREVEKLVEQYEKIDVSDAFQIVSIKHSWLSKFTEIPQPVLITADKELAKVARKEGLNAWYIINEPYPKKI